MSIGGGGSGGGPVGVSNPVGTGSSIVFAGNNNWAGWSGWQAVASGAAATRFDFTSPNRVAIKVDFYYSFDYDLLGSGTFWGIEINLNGEDILKPKVEIPAGGDTAGMPLENRIKFIIMPQTRVIIKGVTSDAGSFCGGTLLAKGLYE